MDAATIEAKVDATITAHRTTAITYHPYVSGPVDVYKQRTKTYGTDVEDLVGRAIHNPTKEQLTVIGDGESFEIAFLFSRTQMRLRFPAAEEGEWMDTSAEISWRNRRYKIEKAKPTGQVFDNFMMMAVMGKTIQGRRNP